MSLNLLAYLIYGVITIFTIVYVGGVLHKNGQHYILKIFLDNEFGRYVNDVLLAGYYFFNIGYVFLTLTSWKRIENYQELVELIGEKTGLILLMLGILHLINIMGLQVIAHFKNQEING